LIIILIASLVTFLSGFGNLISIIEPFSFLKFEISDSYSRYINFSTFENTYLINNEWWRLFAPVFIHFSLIHLVFNCLWIYVLGQQIEKIDGKILFITLIIFSGICGNYAQFISTGPSLFGGLSGCVYGMFGYTMITEFQKSRIIYGLPPAIYIFMIAWLVLGFIGVLSLFGLGNIANFAHLGGLIAGVIMAMVVTIISKDSYLDEKN
jgi:GlpG protein